MQRFVVAGADLRSGSCRSSWPSVGTPSTRQKRSAVRRRDLAGVELVVRIEGGLDCLQRGIERAEEARRELGPEALAVLAPEEPPYCCVSANTSSEISRTSGLLRRVLHVQRRADVQAPRVDMAEHAVVRARAGPAPHGTRRCSRRGSRAGRPCPRRRAWAACSPCMLPSRPTDFLRIDQIAATAARAARDRVAAAVPRPPAGERRLDAPSAASTGGLVAATNSTMLTPRAARPRVVREELRDPQPDRVLSRERRAPWRRPSRSTPRRSCIRACASRSAASKLA